MRAKCLVIIYNVAFFQWIIFIFRLYLQKCKENVFFGFCVVSFYFDNIYVSYCRYTRHSHSIWLCDYRLYFLFDPFWCHCHFKLRNSLHSWKNSSWSSIEIFVVSFFFILSDLLFFFFHFFISIMIKCFPWYINYFTLIIQRYIFTFFWLTKSVICIFTFCVKKIALKKFLKSSRNISIFSELYILHDLKSFGDSKNIFFWSIEVYNFQK